MGRLKLADWSEIANIVGAVTVVVSLVFVGLQVRDNTAAIRSQNQRALVDSLETLELSRIEDPEVAGLMLRAERGDELDALDRSRLEALTYLYFNNWEQGLHDHRKGLLEPAIWEALDAWLRSKMAFAYFRSALAQAVADGTYSPEFTRHLQDVQQDWEARLP